MVILEIEAGQAVQIGPDVVVKVSHKSGRKVRLKIETTLPVEHLHQGIEPKPYTTGISMQRRRVAGPVA